MREEQSLEGKSIDLVVSLLESDLERLLESKKTLEQKLSDIRLKIREVKKTIKLVKSKKSNTDVIHSITK